MIGELTVKTKHREAFLDITDSVEQFVRDNDFKEGLCVVYVPHTTAGVTINERADPDVVKDILNHLGKMIPRNNDFRHVEGNSDAHIKCSLVGSSVNIFVKDGRPMLGTWQGIFFAEFDGPRRRKVQIQLIVAN